MKNMEATNKMKLSKKELIILISYPFIIAFAVISVQSVAIFGHSLFLGIVNSEEINNFIDKIPQFFMAIILLVFIIFCFLFTIFYFWLPLAITSYMLNKKFSKYLNFFFDNLIYPTIVIALFFFLFFKFPYTIFQKPWDEIIKRIYFTFYPVAVLVYFFAMIRKFCGKEIKII